MSDESPVKLHGLARNRARKQRSEQRKRLAEAIKPFLTNAEKEVVLHYGVMIILGDVTAGLPLLSDDLTLDLFRDFLAKRVKEKS